MAAALDLSFMAGRTVAVMGLGRSGAAAARALAGAGALVWAWDDGEARRAGARALGAEIVDLAHADLAQVDAMVWSPGIPHAHPTPHPVAERARGAGKALICDIELLARASPDATAVGVTGANGKSTTTALIGHVLGQAGRPVAVGGNIGAPALGLPALGSEGVYVIELSSYQLELIDSAHFTVGVLLNITPDHLDRHGGMAGYVAAKRRLFRRMGPGDAAIICDDDRYTAAIADALEAAARCTVTRLSTNRARPGGAYMNGSALVDDLGASPGAAAERVVDLSDLAALRGAHNHQNALAAYAACRALGVARGAIVAGLRSFSGLAHRQQTVASAAGVRFVDDSKATNADAAATALGAHDDIYWIAGGVAKAGGAAALAPLMARVRRAYLIGAAADAFADDLRGSVDIIMSGDLTRAVEQAWADARRDGAAAPVVLLSPACASFDQFADFEARGDAFAAAARAIAAAHGEPHGEPHGGGAS